MFLLQNNSNIFRKKTCSPIWHEKCVQILKVSFFNRFPGGWGSGLFFLFDPDLDYQPHGPSDILIMKYFQFDSISVKLKTLCIEKSYIKN